MHGDPLTYRFQMVRLFLTRHLFRHMRHEAQLGFAPVCTFPMSARNERKSDRS